MRYEALDLAGLAERLVAARKAADVRQEDAAVHIGVSRPTFIAMEKGTRRPRPEELVKLAELYKVPLNNLLRSNERPQQLRPHFRSFIDASAADQPEVASALEKLASYVDDYIFLQNLLEAKGVAHFPPSVRIPPGPIERFAEHCAQEERARLNLGAHQPIYTPRKILEEAGLHVFLEKLDSKLAGLYVFVPEFGYCILVNRSHPRERQHWTIAHEYGHFLAERDRPGVDYLRPAQRKSESERFADAFAAAFLMPETGVHRRFYEEVERTGDFKVADLCRMADYFAVSLMAMTLRLEALGLVPRGSWDRVSESRVPVHKLREGAGVEQSRDDDSLEPYPQRYKLLAVQAFQQEKVSEGQLSKLLRCSRIEARDIVEDTSKTADDENGAQSVVPLSLTHSLLESATG